jgi:exodeoxyribonuclease VII small subunit
MAKKKISYSEALKEIETITAQIEAGELEIDLLSEKVRRVTELIKICKDKLHKTEEEVNKILSPEDSEE